MPNKPKAKRSISQGIGQMEKKLPKSKKTKVSLEPKVSYVLRKDHAKPTKLA
jgi:hypothetical protein